LCVLILSLAERYISDEAGLLNGLCANLLFFSGLVGLWTVWFVGLVGLLAYWLVD